MPTILHIKGGDRDYAINLDYVSAVWAWIDGTDQDSGPERMIGLRFTLVGGQEGRDRDILVPGENLPTPAELVAKLEAEGACQVITIGGAK